MTPREGYSPSLAAPEQVVSKVSVVMMGRGQHFLYPP
jgi:hypothetical protein